MTPYEKDIRLCNDILRTYANTEKLNGAYQLPQEYSEQALKNNGKLFDEEEFICYLKWMLLQYEKVVNKFKQAKEAGKREKMTWEEGWRLQRLLISLMFSFSGGLRREVIGRLQHQNITINADGVLLTYMTREKAIRQKTNEIPLPAFLKDFIEVFLQFGRPALLTAEKDGQVFNPKSLWVSVTGSAMQLNYISKEVKRLGQEFNFALNITPITFRRDTLTRLWRGSIKLTSTLEEFIQQLSDLLNVEGSVMKLHYNRFSTLNRNHEAQLVVTAAFREAVALDLASASQSMKELLNGVEVIPKLAPVKISRPVRKIVDNRKWQSSERFRKLGEERKALAAKKRAKRQKRKEEQEKKKKKLTYNQKQKERMREKRRNQEYEIEAIVGKEVRKGELFYRVKWVGYKYTTWEPLAAIYNCWELIQDYEVQH